MSSETEIPVTVTEPSSLSKNQQRKQKRFALLLEQRKAKRKEEKAKQKKRRLEKKKNNEHVILPTRHSLKAKRMEDSSCRIRICMDCRYDTMMSDISQGK